MGADSLDQAWRHLQVHLRWIDQPWIGFVFAAGSSDSAELIERTRAVLSLSGQSLRVLRPADPEELRNLTAEILTLQDSRACLWAEGVRLTIENPHHEDPWVEAWSWLLQRLNERRERILRHLRGGLILSMPRILKTEVAVLAPDLWSIRALSLDLGPAGASGPLSGEDLSAGLRLDFGETTGDRLPPGTGAPGASSLRLALADEERLQDAFHEATGSGDESSRLRSDLARAKLMAAEELLRAGHPADAIRRAEAVRDLTASRPEFAARAHALLARARSGMGDGEAVVTDWERAIGLYRKLVKDRPDVFLPDLGMSLHNLGIRLSDLGWREEALAAAKEAVEIYRHLAADHPDVFLPDLASSLNNLGGRLSDFGRCEEALEAVKEAVKIYRRLAEDRPDVFLPNLAMSLNNLGNSLSDLGRREEALETAKEAVEIYRRLAEDRPDAFLPDLAMNLNNLGIGLSHLGRREEALAAAKEAVEIRRRLAEDRPDVFLPDLASSLNGLAARLFETKRFEEALPPALQAVGIMVPVAERWPEVFAGKLQNAVRTLERVLERVEGSAEARETLAKARTLLERIGEG